ncbi:DUF2934 domain-containing protein [Antarctobacter heliothermus]|uniref:DUF2934 domain-containing protein n=1 Tax=Antarctobacter heliothermus TaxID=74033 RepID=A0A239GGJ6_9RHOB|nr:DUF2934 domain-containing protein [Antarctobacter heliothermus]SNS68161.1 Protein of unknown function [Antarctobacter heliothermus]
MSTPQLDNAQIAQAAFFLWLEEGRPEGQDRDHWFRATEALTASATVAAKPARKPRAKAAAKPTRAATAAKPKAATKTMAAAKPAAARKPRKKAEV